MRSALRVFGDVGRNRAVLRVVIAYAAFTVTEYAVWIAMLIYAYDNGGASLAGFIAIAQLLPAAFVAPLAGPLADRTSPTFVLAGGYAVQGLGSAAVAVAIMTDQPAVWAYLGAILASSAVSTTRPSQVALVPALTREVNELTAANVLIGWVEGIGILVAGGAVGLFLTFASVDYVFAASALVLAGAVLLVAPLRTPGLSSEEDTVGVFRSIREGSSEIWGSPPVRLLVGLLLAEDVFIGAIDVLFVVMALEVLDVGHAWVGYLNMAYGAGGVLVGGLAIMLVGRRLGPVILLTALVLGVALTVTAVVDVPAVVVVLLTVVGGSRVIFDVGARSLLQRAVAANLVARVFGLAEGLGMLALAVGALAAPAAVALVGGRLALVATALVLPAIVLVRARLLMRLDQEARVPIVEISLLRSLPLFSLLPSQSIEGLARALVPADVEAGAELIREGEEGDRYYVIADGTVEISQHGEHVRDLGRGEGFGEIALLRAVRRTATATARTPLRVFTLDRASFLTAVNGHVPTQLAAGVSVHDLEEGDARRHRAAGTD